MVFVLFSQVAHFKKDEVTEACNQCDKKERGFHLEKERDYSQIHRHMDFEFYKELLNRPLDWSEKKDKHGIPLKNDKKRAAGGFNGSNTEPLGKRRRPSSTFGGPDNPNNIPLGRGQKPEDSETFHFQPLSSEEQGKKIVEKLTQFSNNISNCLSNGKGDRKHIVHSLKSFQRLIFMFKNQEQASAHEEDIVLFQNNYQSFLTALEVKKCERDLLDKLDIYEERLMDFHEAVENMLEENNGQFQDVAQANNRLKYAEELTQNILKYQHNQRNFSRQSKSEINARTENMLSQIRKIKNRIDLVIHRQNPSARNNITSVARNGRDASPVAIDDEKIRRVKADFYEAVLDKVRHDMRKYYENSIDTDMVKIATRAEFDELSKSFAQKIFEAEIKNWTEKHVPVEDIFLTQKMMINIENHINKKMLKRPSLNS